MAKCDPENIPRPCADAFGDITERLARIEEIDKAVHEQTKQANGNVAQLFHTSARHEKRIYTLEGKADDAESVKATWGRRLWHLAVALLMAAGGYFVAIWKH